MSLLAALATVFQWTVKNSLQVTPIIVLVFLITRSTGRRMGASPRYMLGVLVLIGLLMPVAPCSRFSIWNVFSLPALAKRANPAHNPALSRADAQSKGTASQIGQAELRPEKAFTLVRTAAIVWLLVVANLLCIALWRYRKWRQLVEGGQPSMDPRILDELERAKLCMGVKRRVALTIVNGLPGPAVFGVFRVHILLPEGFTDQLMLSELRLVLLHELAHVKRNDLLLGWVSMSVQFFHWFNPLAWWALQRLRADRELVCDAMVMASIEPEQRRSYGKVLLKIAETLWPGREMFSAVASVVSGTSELQRRILMIKHYRKSGTTARVVTVTFGLLLAGFSLTGARQTGSGTYGSSPGRTFLGLNIDAKGEVRLEGGEKVLTMAELRAVLSSNSVSNSELDLHLNADRNAPYDRVVKVVETARALQIARISLATPPSQSLRNTEAADFVSKIDIRYDGPRLANESQIRTNIHVRLGDDISPEAIDNDVRTLYATGLFFSVRVTKDARSEGTRLTYIVRCNPRLARLVFSGNSRFSDADLSKLVALQLGKPFSEKVLFSDAEAIRAAYVKAGLKEARVTYAFEINAESNQGTVTFKIAENQ